MSANPLSPDRIAEIRQRFAAIDGPWTDLAAEEAFSLNARNDVRDLLAALTNAEWDAKMQGEAKAIAEIQTAKVQDALDLTRADSDRLDWLLAGLSLTSTRKMPGDTRVRDYGMIVGPKGRAHIDGMISVEHAAASRRPCHGETT